MCRSWCWHRYLHHHSRCRCKSWCRLTRGNRCWFRCSVSPGVRPGVGRDRCWFDPVLVPVSDSLGVGHGVNLRCSHGIGL